MPSRQPEWMTDAACQYIDPDLFYPEQPEEWDQPKRDGAGLREMYVRIDQAKWVCGRCPVAATCLDHVLGTENPKDRWGIWGGMTASERDTEYERRLQAAGYEQQAA